MNTKFKIAAYTLVSSLALFSSSSYAANCRQICKLTANPNGTIDFITYSQTPLGQYTWGGGLGSSSFYAFNSASLPTNGWSVPNLQSVLNYCWDHAKVEICSNYNIGASMTQTPEPSDQCRSTTLVVSGLVNTSRTFSCN